MHVSFEFMRGRWVIGGGFLPGGDVVKSVVVVVVVVGYDFGGDEDGFGCVVGFDLKADGFTRL